jgi:hypothetical protein
MAVCNYGIKLSAKEDVFASKIKATMNRYIPAWILRSSSSIAQTDEQTETQTVFD